MLSVLRPWIAEIYATGRARSAQTCVSVMLQQRMRPMWKVMKSVRLLEALFFFFQAEDGIRDVAVTGVQTCALPISGFDGGVILGYLRMRRPRIRARHGRNATTNGFICPKRKILSAKAYVPTNIKKIGRASCRERV